MKLAYKIGNLLYHSSHGSCFVREIVKGTGSGKDQLFYSLESKQPRFKGTKFIIDTTCIESSGFHPALSVKDANKILNYLETDCEEFKDIGNGQQKKVSELISENDPHSFSKVVLIYSREKNGKEAKSKREMLGRAVKGLLRELSFVFGLTEEETILKMKNSLNKIKVNPWVTNALSAPASYAF